MILGSRKNNNNEDISIVVPAYNEEHGIVQTIRQIRDEVPGAQIIVVDDCSSDKTFSLARKENVVVIRHKANKGYGGALKTGFGHATRKYIAFLDADLTYRPHYIPKFLEKLEKDSLDIVWGNRFGGRKNEMPWIRKLGNFLLSMIFLLRTFKYIPDTACGERVFKRSVLTKISYGSLPNGLDTITAMTKRIVTRDVKYGIVGMDYHMRGGASKLNLIKDFLRMTRNILLEN